MLLHAAQPVGGPGGGAQDEEAERVGVPVQDAGATERGLAGAVGDVSEEAQRVPGEQRRDEAVRGCGQVGAVRPGPGRPIARHLASVTEPLLRRGHASGDGGEGAHSARG